MLSQRRSQGDHQNQQTELCLYPQWQLIFNKYDRDSDGKISLSELRHILTSESFENDIPKDTVRQILDKADHDQSGFLDYKEFVRMIHHHENRGRFSKLVNGYVSFCTVPRQTHERTQDQVDSGEYEEEYTCYPPALCMIIISLVEIGTFLYDVIHSGQSRATGPAATVLVYNPYKRYEAWRYVSYMFVHVGSFHLVVNLVVQILLGIPLEMVHRGWRVLLVYLAGVVAGSLGTSITDSRVFLAGASGGVYALITAHVASIIMNWKQMQFAPLQLLVFLILTGVDVGTAVYNRYVLEVDDQIGYVAHLAGAVAGLLVGINVLRNLEVRRWERVVWWVSISFYIALMTAAIIWNAAFPDYFPPSRYDE